MAYQSGIGGVTHHHGLLPMACTLPLASLISFSTGAGSSPTQGLSPKPARMMTSVTASLWVWQLWPQQVACCLRDSSRSITVSSTVEADSLGEQRLSCVKGAGAAGTEGRLAFGRPGRGRVVAAHKEVAADELLLGAGLAVRARDAVDAVVAHRGLLARCIRAALLLRALPAIYQGNTLRHVNPFTPMRQDATFPDLSLYTSQQLIASQAERTEPYDDSAVCMRPSLACRCAAASHAR